MFIHIPHDIPKLERIDSPSGRVYQTPTGEAYPSVTAVTSQHTKKSIMEWRKRVGDEEANRISAKASKRGTRIHSLCEDYLSNREVKPQYFDVEAFDALKPVLDKINNIHCLETPLYSHYLKVAGTVDCIAEYEGKLCIIDFKTSSKIKEKSHISNYFMQTAAYAVMFEERTGIPINRSLIIMSVDGEKDASLFMENRDNWIDDFIKLRQEYNS